MCTWANLFRVLNSKLLCAGAAQAQRREFSALLRSDASAHTARKPITERLKPQTCAPAGKGSLALLSPYCKGSPALLSPYSKGSARLTVRAVPLSNRAKVPNGAKVRDCSPLQCKA